MFYINFVGTRTGKQVNYGSFLSDDYDTIYTYSGTLTSS